MSSKASRQRFENSTVIVTGAAGAIGRATVGAFMGEGARVIAADLHTPALGRLEKEARAFDSAIIAVPGDVTEKRYCERLVDVAFAETGRLDVLINNAGVMRRGNIMTISDMDWALSLDVNVTAVFRLCKAAITGMLRSGGGTIVNVASTWGLYPGPDHIAYCTSKAALAAMTQCLGRDHAGDGIRVNAVCPNEVNSAMLRTGFSARGLDPDHAIEELNRSVPLGRIAEPADIADIILFLASEDSRYMAGALVEATGAKPVY